MSRKPLSDEQLEALLGSLDVAAREVLLGPGVDRARVALGDALVAEISSAATIGAAVAVRGGRGRFGTGMVALGLALVLAFAGLVVGALVPGRDSPTAPIGAASASAAAILERAAGTASRQPAVFFGPGWGEYVRMFHGLTSSSYARDAAGKLVGVRFWQTETRQTSRTAAGVCRTRTEDIRERFFSPADRAIARSHHMTLGQLDRIDGASAALGNGMTFPAEVSGGPGAGRPCIAYAWPTLPTQPAALLDALERLLRAERPRPTPADLPADVFKVVSGGLLFDAVPPALRSALFEVLAHLPGVQLLGWRRDPLDRRGIAITIKPVRPGHQNTREVMLFDPNRAEELGVEFVRLRPSPQPHAATFPAGTLVKYTAFVERAIRDLTGGGHLSTAGASKVVHGR
jgi:hypothetical protein